MFLYLNLSRNSDITFDHHKKSFYECKQINVIWNLDSKIILCFTLLFFVFGKTVNLKKCMDNSKNYLLALKMNVL